MGKLALYVYNTKVEFSLIVSFFKSRIVKELFLHISKLIINHQPISGFIS